MHLFPRSATVLALLGALTAGACSVATNAGGADAAPPPVRDWQATAHVPFRSVPYGAPFAVEIVLHAPGPWGGQLHLAWERRDDAAGCWLAVANRFGGYPPSRFRFANAGEHLLRQSPSVAELVAMTPGAWRVRCQLIGEVDGGGPLWPTLDGRTVVSEPIAFEVVPHPGNVRAMNAPGLSLFSPWQLAVSGSPPREDLVIPEAVRKVGGMLPRPGVNAEIAAILGSLRGNGASREVVVAAELLLACRDLARVHRLAAGAERRASAATLQARLEALLAECPPADSPLGGQHADVTGMLVQLLKLEDPAAAGRRIDALRAKRPALAAWLEQVSEFAVILPFYLVGE